MEPEFIPPEPIARVRNTFIEVYVPPMEEIMRGRSAPVLSGAQSDPETPEVKEGAGADGHFSLPMAPTSPARSPPTPWASAARDCAGAVPPCERHSVRLRNVPLLDHDALTSQLR